jgi:hypothetical protein
LKIGAKITISSCQKQNLFIQLCLQNNGCLSPKKREAHFEFLTDDELAGMENAVREG